MLTWMGHQRGRDHAAHEAHDPVEEGDRRKIEGRERERKSEDEEERLRGRGERKIEDEREI